MNAQRFPFAREKMHCERKAIRKTNRTSTNTIWRLGFANARKAIGKNAMTAPKPTNIHENATAIFTFRGSKG